MKKIVLVVDDSEADQFLCKHVITQFDSSIIVYQAYDGVEALEKIQKLASSDIPDYIFLDINMPRMDGLEFLHHYHNLPELSSSIIVMLTSSIREDDFERCKAYAYVKSCISKPLSIDHLQQLF